MSGSGTRGCLINQVRTGGLHRLRVKYRMGVVGKAVSQPCIISLMLYRVKRV